MSGFSHSNPTKNTKKTSVKQKQNTSLQFNPKHCKSRCKIKNKTTHSNPTQNTAKYVQNKKNNHSNPSQNTGKKVTSIQPKALQNQVQNNKKNSSHSNPTQNISKIGAK